jgi:hypothetical protein
MRSELGKECRKIFRNVMKAEFPEYHEDKGQIVPAGRYVWTFRHPTDIWFHILLIVHPTRDEFTVEAGWDFDGKLPRFTNQGMDKIPDHPRLFRMNFLWSGKDYWWPLVLRPEEFERALLYKDDPIEQCLSLVAPAVWAAAEKLKEHLVPVFEQVVQKHGNNPDRRPANLGSAGSASPTP